MSNVISEDVLTSIGHGLRTGFSSLSELFRFRPGGLYVVSGRPGVGKSSFVQSLHRSLGLEADVEALFLTLESTKHQVATRYLSALAYVSRHALIEGQLSEQDWSLLLKTINQLNESGIRIEDPAAPDLTDVESRVGEWREPEQRQVVFIDYLQLIEADTQTASRDATVAKIARGLKAVAKDHNLPIIAVSSTNRRFAARTHAAPPESSGLVDLRDSGAIEHVADVVMFVEPDPDAVPQAPIRQVRIAKNRYGASGTVHFRWDAAYYRFSEFRGDEG